MPFIEEEELAKLQQELESLKLNEEELEQKIATSEQENKVSSKNVKSLLVLLILLTIASFVFGFLYFQTKKEKQDLSLQQDTLLSKKIDSLQSVYQANGFSSSNNEAYNDESDVVDGLIYTIQIGAFRKYDLSKYPKDELKNFRSMPNRDLKTYSIGKFKTADQARSFLKEIRRIGIRDAFILPIKDGERIGLKEAIAIENQ